MDPLNFKEQLRRARSPEEISALLEEQLRPKNFHEVLGHLMMIDSDPEPNMQVKLKQAEQFFGMFFAPDYLRGNLKQFAEQFSNVMFEWTLSRSLLEAGWSAEKLHSRRTHVRTLMNTWWQFVAKAFLAAEIVEKQLGQGSCTTDRFWTAWNEISKDRREFDELIKGISGTEQELYLRLMV